VAAPVPKIMSTITIMSRRICDERGVAVQPIRE
jgi:hypothetical protein